MGERRYRWIWPGLVGSAFVVVLVVRASSDRLDAGIAGFAVLATLIAALGSAITASRPGNRIAWLLHTTAIALLLSWGTSLVAEAGEPPLSPDFWDYTAAVIYSTVVEVAIYPALLILFVFPTGQYLSRRWRWAGWLAAITTIAMALTAAFSEEVGRIWDPFDEYWNLDNPVGFLPPGAAEFMVSQAVTVTVVLALGGVVAMVVRFRRSDLVVQEQVKWLAYAAGLSGAALLLQGLSSNELVWTIVPMLALTVIPVAITVAITRYKLFEIDRLISRTISYALVVGFLAAAYFGLVTVVTSLIPTQDSLAVAAATLAVAALFNPVRKRVQRVVDRRFNRSRYQAILVSERFAEQLRHMKDVEAMGSLWKDTVDDYLQPSRSGVWLDVDGS